MDVPGRVHSGGSRLYGGHRADVGKVLVAQEATLVLPETAFAIGQPRPTQARAAADRRHRVLTPAASPMQMPNNKGKTGCG